MTTLLPSASGSTRASLRLNISLQASHIAATQKHLEEHVPWPLNLRGCRAAAWPLMHAKVEEWRSGERDEHHPALERFSCNCNKGEMEAVWCVTMATDMFS